MAGSKDGEGEWAGPVKFRARAERLKGPPDLGPNVVRFYPKRPAPRPKVGGVPVIFTAGAEPENVTPHIPIQEARRIYLAGEMPWPDYLAGLFEFEARDPEGFEAAGDFYREPGGEG